MGEVEVLVRFVWAEFGCVLELRRAGETVVLAMDHGPDKVRFVLDPDERKRLAAALLSTVEGGS